MTPAIEFLAKHHISYTLHTYEHRSSAPSYGMEAAEMLGVAATRVFKTLIVRIAGGRQTLAVALVSVDKQLSVKRLAMALKAKKAGMADPKEAERVTGYLQGGISPLGQKRKLVTVIDTPAFLEDHIYISAGRRGLEIEMSAVDLARLTEAIRADISA